jgi:hypothetical protein
MKYFFLILIVINPLLLSAQRKRETEMDLTFNYSPILVNRGNLIGLGFDFEGPIGRRSFTGVGFTLAGGGTNNSYGYNTTDPRLTYIDLGWINEYRFLNRKKVKANIFVTNAAAFLELGDGHTQNGTHTYNNILSNIFGTSKGLADNLYYSIQPGANIAFAIRKNSFIDSIFLKANYNFMYGFTEFPAGRNDFEMVTFSVGVRAL